VKRIGIALLAAGAVLLAFGCKKVQINNPHSSEADNDLCYVCHADFAGEELVVSHQRKGVGCADCHGESIPHMSNEENIIPPDIMFERGDVNGLCLKCHEPLPEKHEKTARGATEPKEVCTDCHGNHHVAHPRRKWDKKTRKLIYSE